jgi:hypothetical protein
MPIPVGPEKSEHHVVEQGGVLFLDTKADTMDVKKQATLSDKVVAGYLRLRLPKVYGREQREEERVEPVLHKTISVVPDVHTRSHSSLHYIAYEGLRRPIVADVGGGTIFNCLIWESIPRHRCMEDWTTGKSIVSVQLHSV